MQTRVVKLMRLMAAAGVLSVLCWGGAWDVRSAQARPPSPVIDDFGYRDDAAAHEVWRPMAGSRPVSAAARSGEKTLRLPCVFAGNRTERASWDRMIELDLTECRGVQFQFFCRDASPVSYFSLYFQSGPGWYAAPFYPQSSGWNTIEIDKSNMRIEGQPAGWGSIRTLRLSAWRGSDTDTDFEIRDLRMTGVLGVDTLVALIRCDSAAATRPEEARSAEQFAATVAKGFEEVGVGCASLSDTQLTATALSGAKLAVLPHNPAMPEAVVDALAGFLRGGGKLLAFYDLPARLRPMVGMETGGYFKPERSGTFAAMRFEPGQIPGAPVLVKQKSWNIVEPKPVAGLSRVVGQWLNEAGQPAGHVAAVASSNAVWLSHVALRDDPENQSRLLLALAGSLAPEIWRQAVDRDLGRIGRLAGLGDYDEAAREIERNAGGEERVAALLSSARRERESALNARGEGRYPEAMDQAKAASQTLLEAFCVAQRPAPGEFRAFWCHSAFGVKGMSWDEAARCLAENGFTAVLPNMLWGGIAYYPSSVLPGRARGGVARRSNRRMPGRLPQVRAPGACVEGELECQPRAEGVSRQDAQRGSVAGGRSGQGRALALPVPSGESTDGDRFHGRTRPAVRRGWHSL